MYGRSQWPKPRKIYIGFLDLLLGTERECGMGIYKKKLKLIKFSEDEKALRISLISKSSTRVSKF